MSFDQPASGRGIDAGGVDASADSIAPPHDTFSRVRARIGLAAFDSDRQPGSFDLAEAVVQALLAALPCFRWMGPVRRIAGIADNDTDFLLTGSVRRQGAKFRILPRLLDQRMSDAVVWAGRFDIDADPTGAGPEQIAGMTAAQIDARLWHWEAARPAAGEAAIREPRDLVHLAVPHVYRLDRDGFMTAGAWLRHALKLDPADAAAHAWFIQWCLLYAGQGWAGDPAACLAHARDLSERAVRLNPEDALCLTLAGHVHAFLDHRPDEALRLHERAIAANPNLPLSWCLSGLAASYVGAWAEGARRVRHAEMLSPGDPFDYFVTGTLAIAHLIGGEFEAATAYGERAIALNPLFSSSRKTYLAALGHLGDKDEAAPALAALLKLEPGFSVEQALRRCPYATAESRELYAVGLRAAGLR